MISYFYEQSSAKRSSYAWYSLWQDDYDAFMHYGSAGAHGRAMGMEQLPAWVRLTQHPSYDLFWQGQALDKILGRTPLTVPTMLVGGQWDQEDSYGVPAVWNAIKAQANGNAHLVLGPWRHAQANRDGSRNGVLDFGTDTAKWFREKLMIPFLDTYLKEYAAAADTPTVTVFETGTNVWRRLSDWPSACEVGCSATSVPLYVGANGTEPRHCAAAGNCRVRRICQRSCETYRARPNPPPHEKGSSWGEWLVDDQRFAAARPDVLVYTSDVLTRRLKMAGQPIAHLFASTTGTDSDWVVKLIDVYPGVVPDHSTTQNLVVTSFPSQWISYVVATIKIPPTRHRYRQKRW
jgi:putative CocE/NonD family hydrolase